MMTHPDAAEALRRLRVINRWRWTDPRWYHEARDAALRALAVRRSRRTWLDRAMDAVAADEGEG